ncbi:MFS transporter [Promineifilum sp.]|uniref:MFS transporter n=1 Tax=Promineifilum sp. TaxID=2664178 RepID=UPI0035B32F24
MNRLRRGLSAYAAMIRLFSRNVWLVLLFGMGSGLTFGIFLFTFNFYVLSLGPGYDEAFLGTLQSAASLATIAMALPAAYIAQRYSPKWVMIASGLIGAVAYLGLVLFPSQWPLVAFRMLAGVSMSLGGVAGAPFLMAHTGARERQWAFSFMAGLSTVASFFGNLLAGILPGWLGGWAGAGPTETLSYQLSLGSIVLLSLFSIIPLLFIRATRLPQGAIELPWVLVRRHARLFAMFLLPSLVIGLGAGLMQPFMNVYFRNVYEQPDPAIGVVFALGGLAMAVGQFAGPPMADRYGKIKTVMLTQGLSIPFLMTLGLGAYLVPSGRAAAELFFIIAGVAYIFRLALMNLSNPVYQTFVLERVPEQAQALSVSLTNLVFQVGWFIMPQVSGQLQVAHGPAGFTYVFAGVTLLYATAIVIEWLFFGRGKVPAEVATEGAAI